MELTQNIWARYGFRGNPFDTRALSASAESLPPTAKRFIFPHHRTGRQVFYCASEDVRIVRDLPDQAQRALFD